MRHWESSVANVMYMFLQNEEEEKAEAKSGRILQAQKKKAAKMQ